jgi:hypothetical protein
MRYQSDCSRGRCADSNSHFLRFRLLSEQIPTPSTKPNLIFYTTEASQSFNMPMPGYKTDDTLTTHNTTPQDRTAINTDVEADRTLSRKGHQSKGASRMNGVPFESSATHSRGAMTCLPEVVQNSTDLIGAHGQPAPSPSDHPDAHGTFAQTRESEVVPQASVTREPPQCLTVRFPKRRSSYAATEALRRLASKAARKITLSTCAHPDTWLQSLLQQPK